MVRTLFFFISVLFIQHACAQASHVHYGSASILHDMQKLKTVGAVLYIAAHPDDENTRLLAYLANERKLRTAYLSLTRGDGGQNLIGKEQGAALGLIRTQELLAARRIDGALQYFTRAVDFGFSKTAAETFEQWHKDSVLSDVVWVIRSFQPDVIITRFPTTGEGGHGHHTASAILAEEAFEAAADPGRFQWQLKYVQPWKTKRLFWNTFNFGGRNTTSADQLKLDVGIFNPLLGKYYGEIAAESRSMHKSQGFGAASTRGTGIEYFKQIKGDIVHKDIFENLQLDWNPFSHTGELNKLIDAAVMHFDVLAPQKSVDALLHIYRKLKAVNTGDRELLTWKQSKLQDVQNLIVACAGVWMEVVAKDSIATINEDFETEVKILAHNHVPVQLTDEDTSKILYNLKNNEVFTRKDSMRLSELPAYGMQISTSEPYWLKHPVKNNLFRVDDLALLGMPEKSPELMMIFHTSIKGVPFDIARPVVYRYVDPVRGEVYRPLEILPDVTVNLSKELLLFTSEQPQKTEVTVKANKANVSGKLSVKIPAGWKAFFSDSTFTLNKKGDEKMFEIMVHPASRQGEAAMEVSAVAGGKSFTRQIKRIHYEHIPPQFMLEDATVKLARFHLKTTGMHIGYIPGAGDDVAALLAQAGYRVTVLDNQQLAEKDLSALDAIVTGVRAYNINEQLNQYHNKLMEYVKNGGNLVVQYNTNSGIGPLRAKIGPYPFTISRNRVTDEHAKVTFTNPGHSILNYPNKISEQDFAGWVQERGVYFVGDMHANYRTVLSMHDKDEAPENGSIIVAEYGKGNFVYTGLAFFRQLPAANQGAFKLFVNLLSIPKR